MKPSSLKHNSRKGTRQPRINPTEQRKLLLYLAQQIRNGLALTKEQSEYLASCFERIGNGESADAVFHVKRGRGQKIDNESRRIKMSLVFSFIAQLISPQSEDSFGAGMTLIDAFIKAGPLARELMGTDDPNAYSPEYLSKLWNDPSYAHMKTTLRTPLDPDSPFALTTFKN